MTVWGQIARAWGLIKGQSLLTDRELGDLFIRGHFENKLRSGEIHGIASSSTQKRSYNGKKESSIMYDQKGRNKSDLNQSVEEVETSNLTPVQQQR